jgi:ribosomal protein L17
LLQVLCVRLQVAMLQEQFRKMQARFTVEGIGANRVFQKRFRAGDVAPFLGIKAIDLVLVTMGVA